MSVSHSYEIRSKNAGPFWLTFDIFCANTEVFKQLSAEPLLAEEAVARMLHGDPHQVKVFRVQALNVVKITLPRPITQGALHDRDMHGAQWGHVLTEVLARAGV